MRLPAAPDVSVGPNSRFNPSAMLRSILLTGLRSARRQPGTALFNVIGLAVGVAACLLIGLHIYHELAVDHFHEHADRI